MSKGLIQQRIQQVREGAGLDRHQFAARINLSYTAVWNWETKGTATSFVPEDKSLKAIATEFAEFGVTFDWLKTGIGKAPTFTKTNHGSGGGTRTQPNVHKVLEGIRELEKLPEVAAYRALLKSLGNSEAVAE